MKKRLKNDPFCDAFCERQHTSISCGNPRSTLSSPFVKFELMFINRIIIFCLVLYLLSGCSARSVSVAGLDDQTNELKKADISPTPKTPTDKNIPESLVKNTKGVVVLSNKYGKNDFVRIYNADGSLWYKYTYYYDDSDGKFDYEHDDFSPFAFHPDYFLLALKCTGEDKNRYEVIVNEETGLKKFVNKSDAAFKFETWEQHLQQVFSVDFDRDKNPLRDAPAGKIITDALPAEVKFHLIGVRGDWLELRWNIESNTNNTREKTETGWIKWKDDEMLLIELFYLS
jgi:hypothetical protein